MLNDLLNMFGGLTGPGYSRPEAQWAAQSSQTLRRPEASIRSEVAELETRLDHLALVCMAMWSLLSQKTSLSAEDLVERIRQIDLADGKADGKLTRTIKTCRKCNRVMSPRHSKCLYCGSEDLSDPFSGAL